MRGSADEVSQPRHDELRRPAGVCVCVCACARVVALPQLLCTRGCGSASFGCRALAASRNRALSRALPSCGGGVGFDYSHTTVNAKLERCCINVWFDANTMHRLTSGPPN